MSMVSVSRERVAMGMLPAVCTVCGADARGRYAPVVAARWVEWALFVPVLGLVAFWSSVLFAPRAPQRRGFPLCERHRTYWQRRGFYVFVGFAVTVGLIAVGVAVAPPLPRGRDDVPHWLFGVIGLWVLSCLSAFQMLNARSVRPVGGNRRAVVLCAVSGAFAAAVEGRKFVKTPPRRDSRAAAAGRPGR